MNLSENRFYHPSFKFLELSFLCFVVVLLFSGCDRTEEPDPFEWQPFGLEDKRIFELSISENFLYAAAGKDGLFRKDLNDDRSQWEYLGLAEPDANFGIRTFYRNPTSGTMYAGFFEYNWDGPGLFRSTDDGESWEPYVRGISERYEGRSALVTKLNAPKDQPSQIFAGTSSGLFKLKEDNSGWEFLSESAEFGKGVLSMSFNSQNNQDIWAGGVTGFDQARLIISKDGGETWNINESISDITEFTDEVNAITIHPGNTRVLYVALDRKIGKTEDGGESWRMLESDLNKEDEFKNPNDDIFTFFTDLNINPINTNELLASGKFLYRSPDAGNTWKLASDTTRLGITNIKVDWDNRVVYGAILEPEKGVFKIRI